MPELTLNALLDATRGEGLRALVAPFWGEEAAAPKHEGTRLQPPICYWGVYRGTDGRRVVFKSFFSEATYREYVAQIEEHYPERIGLPGHPAGGIVLHPDLNAVLWGFPFDPAMSGLQYCLDGQWAAEVLEQREPPRVEALQYRPEVGAVLAYYAGDGEAVAYGKVTPEQRVGTIWLVMDRLWTSRVAQEGVLRTAQPLGYRPTLGLLLQAPVPGKTVGRDRNRLIFQELVRYAGPALAALHTEDLPFGQPRGLDELLMRIEAGLSDVVLAAPTLRGSLQRLLGELQRRSGRGGSLPLVPSHGDFKYDQFLEADGQFTLIDFELFCRAEPSLDLGTFCAYLPNTTPRDWQEGLAVELLRAEFLRTYEEATGAGVDLDRMALYEAAMLGIRGLSHVWTRQRHWKVRAGQLLDLALERLVDPRPRRA